MPSPFLLRGVKSHTSSRKVAGRWAVGGHEGSGRTSSGIGRADPARLPAKSARRSPGSRQELDAALLLGLAISEYRDEFRRGDFLIRSLVGLDPRTGALAVTDRVRLGQTVQFQVRDAATADEDLGHMLRAARKRHQSHSALLFTCNDGARGCSALPTTMRRPCESEAARWLLAGSSPRRTPCRGRNFIHGFTASAVLFE